MEKEISLLEALTGVDFNLVHLDGKVLRIKTNPGEIVQPDQVMTCEDWGIPFHKTNYKHGNLFITFKINFPDQLSQQQMETVQQLLSGQRKSAAELRSMDEADETVNLVKFQESHKNTQATGGQTQHQDSEEENDDEEMPGHGPQCAQ